MRLIDADALSARFEAMQEGANMRDHVYLMGVLSMIDNTPTIDAVPVVRCKECIHAPSPESPGQWRSSGRGCARR